LAVEYPGYSLNKYTTASEDSILKDAERVINFLVSDLLIPLSKIILLGRSIGCGPATYIATRFCVKGLILISPFASLEKLMGDLLGVWGKTLVKNRFDNQQRVKDIKCPLLLLHGQSDNLIPSSHSALLYQNSVTFTELYIHNSMTHSELNYQVHLLDPIISFFQKIGFQSSPQPIHFPKYLFD